MVRKTWVVFFGFLSVLSRRGYAALASGLRLVEYVAIGTLRQGSKAALTRPAIQLLQTDQGDSQGR